MGHGIDTEFFSVDSRVARSTDVLSAGRLSPIKRTDLIIRAAAHFKNEVRIAGDGPQRKRLEDLAQTLGLASRVHFLGAKNQDQLRAQYRACGVFVHTSETGSLDKVVLEALACGLPVITTSPFLTGLPVTKVEATPEAIAQTVTTQPHQDPQALAAFVREHHSLSHLISAILNGYGAPASR
jgi:glycosyltransferase involved in cell wall biosynthesis